MQITNNDMKKLFTIALLLLTMGVMAQKQHINQTAPKDNLKQAFEKTNENFDELYVSRDSVAVVLDDYTELGAALPTLSTIQLPVYTTAQIAALTGMTAGAVVYNSTEQKISLYIGTGWFLIAIVE